MVITATSLKLPRHLKTRITRLAKRSGETPHAFMLRALEEQVQAAERYQSFLDEAARADETMVAKGLGYSAQDVHAYLEAKVAGGSATRPKPVRWRQ